MYSDEWIRKGFHSGERTELQNGQPIYYRYWYDEDNNKIGATIDFEYAEDAHYEFLFEEFEKLISLWGGENKFVKRMQNFFKQKQPYFVFSNYLDENSIQYKRIVFY